MSFKWKKYSLLGLCVGICTFQQVFQMAVTEKLGGIKFTWKTLNINRPKIFYILGKHKELFFYIVYVLMITITRE